MKGLWIQDDGAAGLALSPLLSGIGTELLPPGEISAVRTALGDEIVRKKVISATDVDRALTYFAFSEHWNRAAIYYAIALDSYLQAPRDLPLPGFIRRWLPSPPRQIEEPLTAFVLASQIAFLDRNDEDADGHIRVIIEILERRAQATASEADCLACISAALSTGPLRGATAGAMTLRLARLAVTFIRKLRELGSAEAKQAGRSVFATLWISIGNVRTPADLHEWSVLIAFLTDDELAQSAPNADIAQQGMRLMPQAAVKAEGRRTTPRWVALDAALQQLEAAAIEKRIYGLAVGAAAARILAKGGYQNDIDGAVGVAETLLGKPLEPAYEFLIRIELGHQLLRAKRNKDAIEQFDRALALDVKAKPIDLLHVHGASSVSLRESNRDKSVEHAKETVNLARRESVPRSELVRALAEYALTFSDIRSAFPVWNEAVATALSEPTQEDEERGLYAVLGYVTGYLMGMATTGAPPIGDSGQPMHAPIPGMFLQEKAPAARYFNPALMAAHMEAIANALGHQGQATQWAERAAEFVEAGADTRTRALLVRTSVPFWIRKDSFSVAIHNAAQSISVIAVQGEKASDGERYARAIALFPAVLRAATLRIQLAPIAASAAREIVNTCREREAIGGDGQWELAAQLVEAALIGDRSPLGALTARAKSSEDEGLKWLGHLMEMYIANADLADALKSQVMALHASATRGQELPAFSQHITFPFLHSFWVRAIEREPHQFSLRFKVALDEAAQLGGAVGVRVLISSLLLEFPQLQAPSELKAWLKFE